MRRRDSFKHLTRRKLRQGFTLVEVIIALAILAVSLCGLLLTFINMFVLTDLVRDASSATNAVLAKTEEIKNLPFANLSTAAGAFNLTAYGFPNSTSSKGFVEVTQNFNGYALALTEVRVMASYLSRNRTIGEDRNFNGVLDAGEDANNNTRMDSPIEVVTLFSK